VGTLAVSILNLENKLKMSKLFTFCRIIAVCLLFIIGINAIVAGFLFIVDPSGIIMGLTTDYLKHSPFQSYLIPGIILFMFNGILNVAVGILSIKKAENYSKLILCQGLILLGWISIQVYMVRDINPLHIIMFFSGIILTICSLVINKNAYS